MSLVTDKPYVSKSKYFTALGSWIVLIAIFVAVNVHLLVLNRGLIGHHSLIVFDLMKLFFYTIPFLTIWYGFKIKESNKALNSIKMLITAAFLVLASLQCLLFFVGVLFDLISGTYKDFNKGYDRDTHTLIHKVEFPNNTLKVFLVMGGGAAGYADTKAVLSREIGLGFIHNIDTKTFEYCKNTEIEKISDTQVRIYGCGEEMVMEDIN